MVGDIGAASQPMRCRRLRLSSKRPTGCGSKPEFFWSQASACLAFSGASLDFYCSRDDCRCRYYRQGQSSEWSGPDGRPKRYRDVIQTGRSLRLSLQPPCCACQYWRTPISRFAGMLPLPVAGANNSANFRLTFQTYFEKNDGRARDTGIKRRRARYEL